MGKGLIVGDDFIERKVGDEIFRFCSDECAKKYMKEKEEQNFFIISKLSYQEQSAIVLNPE